VDQADRPVLAHRCRVGLLGEQDQERLIESMEAAGAERVYLRKGLNHVVLDSAPTSAQKFRGKPKILSVQNKPKILMIIITVHFMPMFRSIESGRSKGAILLPFRHWAKLGYMKVTIESNHADVHPMSTCGSVSLAFLGSEFVLVLVFTRISFN
jgi:hypothetical protein